MLPFHQISMNVFANDLSCTQKGLCDGSFEDLTGIFIRFFGIAL